MKLSSPEKIILTMLAEIHKALQVKSEINPDFVLDVIQRDYAWALVWEYPDVFAGSANESPKEVREVCDILNMWTALEASYAKCDNADKQKIKKATAQEDISFDGFDGNAGNQHLYIAKFLVEELNRYKNFKGREFDSHSSLSTIMHKYMVPAFQAVTSQRTWELSADEIIEIMNSYKENATQ